MGYCSGSMCMGVELKERDEWLVREEGDSRWVWRPMYVCRGWYVGVGW